MSKKRFLRILFVAILVVSMVGSVVHAQVQEEYIRFYKGAQSVEFVKSARKDTVKGSSWCSNLTFASCASLPGVPAVICANNWFVTRIYTGGWVAASYANIHKSGLVVPGDSYKLFNYFYSGYGEYGTYYQLKGSMTSSSNLSESYNNYRWNP